MCEIMMWPGSPPGSSCGAAMPSICDKAWKRVRVLSWSGLRLSGFFFGAIDGSSVDNLVAEIHELQRLLDLQPAHEGDGILQIVLLLAADAQLVALNRDLDLHLAVLDLFDDALADGLVD